MIGSVWCWESEESRLRAKAFCNFQPRDLILSKGLEEDVVFVNKMAQNDSFSLFSSSSHIQLPTQTAQVLFSEMAFASMIYQQDCMDEALAVSCSVK